MYNNEKYDWDLINMQTLFNPFLTLDYGNM